MKKNKLFIILALICIFQLAVPVSIMGLREIAEDSGLQGKLKIEAAWYYEETDILDLTISYNCFAVISSYSIESKR